MMFTTNAASLRTSLTTAYAFAGKDKLIPAIRAVHIAAADDGIVEIVATDRCVMSVETLKADGEAFTVTLPRDVVHRLLAMLPKTRETLLDSVVAFSRGDGDEPGRVTVRFIGDVESSLVFAPPPVLSTTARCSPDTRPKTPRRG